MKRALVVSWLVLSGLGIAILLAASSLPRSTLLDLADRARLPHDHCALCGMTRGFLLVSEGNLTEAAAANRASVPLFFVLATNGIATLFYSGLQITRRRHHVRRSSRASASDKE